MEENQLREIFGKFDLSEAEDKASVQIDEALLVKSVLDYGNNIAKGDDPAAALDVLIGHLDGIEASLEKASFDQEADAVTALEDDEVLKAFLVKEDASEQELVSGEADQAEAVDEVQKSDDASDGWESDMAPGSLSVARKSALLTKAEVAIHGRAGSRSILKSHSAARSKAFGRERCLS